MHSNHEAIHMAYTLCLAVATNRFTPKWYAQWQLDTMHIPEDQMTSALEIYAIRIGEHSVTVPMKSLNAVHPPEPYVKTVFADVNYHRNEYMNVIRGR